MGEKPSDNSDTHEDWIQRQLRRPSPRSDTIAAQVGESAENVAVGSANTASNSYTLHEWRTNMMISALRNRRSEYTFGRSLGRWVGGGAGMLSTSLTNVTSNGSDVIIVAASPSWIGAALVLLDDFGVLGDRVERRERQEKTGAKKHAAFLDTAAKPGLWRCLATRPGTKQDDPLSAKREDVPMQRTGLRLLIFRSGTHAGVPDAGVHRFRHTFAINFLRNGGNLLALQDLPGHEQMDTVRIYAAEGPA